MKARFFTSATFVLALLTFFAIVTFSPHAAADTSPEIRARAEARFSSAEADDEAFAFARALARYNEGLALDPESPRAPHADARATVLRGHAEGDFVPYAKLERVRRDAALSSDARVVDELVREASTFPPGPVRVEVWVLAAEAFEHRFGRPGDAEPFLRRVLVDEHAEPVVATKAARVLVTLQLARGDLASAQDTTRVAGSRADSKLLRDVERALRRRNLHRVAIGLLVAMALLAARAVIAAMRRGAGTRIHGALAKLWRLALGYAAYVALFGALLASSYQAGTSKPFLCFGVVLVPLVLTARAWSAAARDSRDARARGGRAVLCGAAALGAAFLVLEGVDVAYLESMGL